MPPSHKGDTVLHIDNSESVRMSAYYSDSPTTQRRAQRIARVILKQAQNPGFCRVSGLLIVDGWINNRLHSAAYWPGKIGGDA